MATTRCATKPGESAITDTCRPASRHSAATLSRTAASAPGAVISVTRPSVLPAGSIATSRFASSFSRCDSAVQSSPHGAAKIGDLLSSRASTSTLAAAQSVRNNSWSSASTTAFGGLPVGGVASGNTALPS